MNGKPTSVLLAGYLGIQSAVLRQWLARRDCECQLAASFEDVCRSLSQAEFDLVFCRYDLPDRTAFPLLDWLEGTRSTLFFYASSGRDNRWLPVIERGERCLDRPLLRTADLPDVLAHILEGDGMRKAIEGLKQIPKNTQGLERRERESFVSRQSIRSNATHSVLAVNCSRNDYCHRSINATGAMRTIRMDSKE